MKRIYNLLLVPLLVCLLLHHSISFSQTTSFIYYGVEQGLSQSQVQGITQDNDGNLWIATLSGLTKYNGKEFKTYSRKDSLAEDWVTTLYKDKKGNIWFGHWAGGVSMFNYSTKKIENLALETFTQFKTVTCILQDNQDRFWIATEGAGIFIYDPSGKNKNTITKIEGLGSVNVYSLCKDQLQNVWIATDKGITIYDSKSAINTTSSFAKITSSDGLLSNHITTLAFVNGNEIWAGTGDEGVQVLKVNPDFDFKNANKSIENAGYIIDKEKGLGANFINCIYEDKSHTVWIGTTGGGVTKVTPYSSKDRREAIFLLFVSIFK